VSGSDIRANPRKEWEFIPSLLRPHFVTRVVLTGSECTGKTTLSERLAAHYATTWSAEYGRLYVDGLDRPLTYADVEAIARGQIEVEEREARSSNGLLIQDTDLISTLVYSRHYFGDAPSWLDDAIRARLGKLYLLSGIDVPWVADGMQRDRGDRREEMQQLFRDALISYGAHWIELSGSVEQRTIVAIKAIDALSGSV
jgi:NadR type nicotinamide-nucleotide adenylyltransferase